MAFFRKDKKPRSRDRPGNLAAPLWNAIAGLKARQDLTGSEAIYAAVSRIANTMACMPLHLYKKADIQWEDPREICVGYAPNPNLTPYGWKLALEACRDTVGKAYILIVPRDDGVTVDRLDPIDPERVQVLRNSDNGELWYQITLDAGELVTVHNTRVIPLHHMSTDGVTGISPIQVLTGTLSYDRQVRELSISQLEGIRDSVVLTYPTNLSREKRDEHVAAFMEAYKKSSGHLILLDGGVTADTIKGAGVDAKVLDVDSITKRKVAAVYNMPPRMIGDAGSSGYSTSEQDIAEFLRLTILPVVKQWEEALNRRLLSYREIQEGYAFRFDMEALMRGDTETMASKHSKLIRSAAMTPNEAREENGKPPLPHGNELLIARDLIPLRIVTERPELLLAGQTDGGEGDKQT